MDKGEGNMPMVRVTMVAVFVVVSVLTLGCDKAPSNGTKVGTEVKPGTPAQPEPAAPPPPEESPVDLIKKAQTLAEAIEMAKSDMTDTQDEQSAGTLLLTVWAATKMRWVDVAVTKNETSFALVKKDADEARGRRMCSSGSIIQIAKEQLGEIGVDRVYTGLLFTNNRDILSFFAVGSTGSLVERSRARFCGVVTGTFDYSNSGGGVGHAVTTVGMFDLPANREEQ
jgi:hypothetical protein